MTLWHMALRKSAAVNMQKIFTATSQNASATIEMAATLPGPKNLTLGELDLN